MAAVYQVSLREVIYLRIAQNYYENLKKKLLLPNYSKTKTYIYSNSVSAAITTLNIDFMWHDKDMKKTKEKRKEKERKRKKTYEATLQTQIWINRGVGSRWAVYGLSGRAQPPQFFYYLVKWKVIKNFPFPNKMCYLSIDIIFRGMVFRWGLDVPTYVQKASVGPRNQAAIAFCAAIDSLQKKTS